ncbi:MAG: arylesterase [Pedobacter sp.]|nr:MAG: arylesterase [Pedobacter sp.]
MTKIRCNYFVLALIFVLSACSSGEKQKNDAKMNDKIQQPAKKVKTILFFGDSLTAGYGLEDPETSFPSRIGEKIDSLKLPYTVVNAGLSGETTAGGRSRIDWLLKQKMDVFVLELGANDGLRGLSVAETTKNLQFIIDQVHTKYPDCKILLTGMMVPPSMGAKYADSFKAVFVDLAASNKIKFVPFLLEGVGGITRLNQADGIHPTAEGHAILAENVWSVLKGML